MKKILLLLFCISLYCTASAQSQYEDVIYLKNGSIIHGIIVEQVPNTSVKIKSGVNVLVYKMDEIAKITKEETKEQGAAASVFKSKGYSGMVELGYTDFPPRAGNPNMPMFSINVINGYMFNPYFFIGIGVGMDASAQNVFNMPLFEDVRVNFLKGKVTPYFDFRLGYNAEFVTSYNQLNISHGFLCNPSIGGRVVVTDKVALSFGIGFKLIATKNGDNNYYNYYYYNYQNPFDKLNGVTFMLGAQF
jgi:hypothetical protein